MAPWQQCPLFFSSSLFRGENLQISEIMPIFAAEIITDKRMSYSQMAQLELLDALNSINSEAELNEFKSILAHYTHIATAGTVPIVRL